MVPWCFSIPYIAAYGWRFDKQLAPGRGRGYHEESVVFVGAWLSLVERLFRVQEAGGSNPLAPTNSYSTFSSSLGLALHQKRAEDQCEGISDEAPVPCPLSIGDVV